MPIISNVDRTLLLNQIIRHEGIGPGSAVGHHTPYRCTAGALTIGYGHNLDANPVTGINKHSSISESEAVALLEKDVHQVEKTLALHLPWVTRLNAARYGVFVNMAFNLGMRGLLNFKTTLALIHDEEFEAAANAMLQSRWAQQVKRRATELSHQMRTGTWQKGVV